jgi:predicted  nucleic acid-binding Zn-ribbon protein
MMMRTVVAEVERRREHIDMIDDDHPLRVTILQCLCDSQEDRPSAQEICHRLIVLKDGPRYAESKLEDNTRVVGPRMDDAEVHRRDEEIRDLQQQLRQSQDERDQLRQQMTRSRGEVTRKNREIEDKARRIAELERERLHHSQQIDELTAGMHEAQQLLHRSEQQFQTDVMGLEQTISEQDLTISRLTTVISELQEDLQRRDQLIQQQRARSEQTSRLRLTSRYGGEALRPIRREPDATVFQNVVYFKYFWGKHIVSYDTESKKWSELPPCPNSSFSMAVIEGILTIIGGKTPNIDPTNTLLSFTDSEWMEEFPPMPTKRYWTISVIYSDSIIVLGGETEGRTVVCTVEVFDIKSREWFVACSLPQPFDSATATVCSEQLFLACGSSENTARCVLSCSISRLLDSCRPATVSAGSGHALREPGIWSRVSDLPFHKMTITNLGDYLLAVGGKKKNGPPSSAVFVYDEIIATWIEIGCLEIPRFSCFAVPLSRNEVMVVGGLVDDGGKEATNSVEFLTMH